MIVRQEDSPGVLSTQYRVLSVFITPAVALSVTLLPPFSNHVGKSCPSPLACYSALSTQSLLRRSARLGRERGERDGDRRAVAGRGGDRECAAEAFARSRMIISPKCCRPWRVMCSGSKPVPSSRTVSRASARDRWQTRSTPVMRARACAIRQALLHDAQQLQFGHRRERWVQSGSTSVTVVPVVSSNHSAVCEAPPGNRCPFPRAARRSLPEHQCRRHRWPVRCDRWRSAPPRVPIREGTARTSPCSAIAARVAPGRHATRARYDLAPRGSPAARSPPPIAGSRSRRRGFR